MRFGHKNTEASVEWQKILGLSSCLPGNSHKTAQSNERGGGVMVASVRQFAKPFFTPTGIFTVIYGEHISHE